MLNWLDLRRWIMRRFSAFDLHWPRNVPKRLGLFGLVLSLIFVYFLLHRSLRPYKTFSKRHCIDDFLARKGIDQPWATEFGEQVAEEWQSSKMAFTGNGFIGLEAFVDRKLIIFANETGRSNLHTGFYSTVDVESPLALEESIIFTDNAGNARHIRCSILSEKCVCISMAIYAHRTRTGLLVQDIHLVNPSSSSFTVTFKRKPSDDFEEKTSQRYPLYTKSFGEGNKRVLVAVMCSAIPNAVISMKTKVEENFRFYCYADKEENPKNDDVFIRRVSSKFAEFYAINSDQLDKEHSNAWASITGNFHLSHSKAPNSMNQADILQVRNLLLSSLRTPFFDSNSNELAKNVHIIPQDSEYCFTGISTMLTPSKLWQKATDMRSLLRTIDIWRTTLEHRGCASLIRKYGAHGMAQAFLLSLSAGTFSNGARRLEFSLSPETDLHRQIKVDGLRIGSEGLVSLEFKLDLGLKPFVIIENKNPTAPLYACTAGCQESPHYVGKAPISLAIKITRPTTSILFLSQQKAELELFKKTLHVIEIYDAPAHEQEKIDLHKHGNNRGGGMPTIFWVILIFCLIAFHLFLFKLLYSEWKNSSAVPYSKFNKKVLFQQ